MTTEEIRAAAAALARELEAGTVTPQLRARVIAVRAALFQRGVFDPVLARFDSATVAPATPAEIARELNEISQSLR